jgi:hypothetical protein
MRSLTRREAISAGTAVIGAATTAVLPSTVAGATSNIDVLWPAYLGRLAECQRLRQSLDQALDIWEATDPEVPDEMRVSQSDIAMFEVGQFAIPSRRMVGPASRDFRWVTAEGWRQALENVRTCQNEERRNARTAFATKQLHLAEAYEAKSRAAKDASGIEAADKAFNAAYDLQFELEQQIMAIPAASILDLKRQAEITARFDDHGMFATALIASVGAFADGGANV